MSYSDKIQAAVINTHEESIAYLFEELQSYDEAVLEENYRVWLREKIIRTEMARKEV